MKKRLVKNKLYEGTDFTLKCRQDDRIQGSVVLSSTIQDWTMKTVVASNHTAHVDNMLTNIKTF